MSAFIIPQAAHARLAELVKQAGPGIEGFYAANRSRLRDEAAAALGKGGMLAPIEVVESAVAGRPDASVAPEVFRRGLLARFALDLPATVTGLDLPTRVVALYPDLTERLARTIPDESTGYTVDGHARDVAHVTGLFLPAPAQDLDLRGRLDPRMVLSAAVRQGRLMLIAQWVRHRLDRPFIELHTDSRHLAHFNTEGRKATFRCAAEILKRRPDLGGALGASWYYDPAVARISPRLAFLQTLPLSAGAFLIRNAQGEIHTRRATLTSPTRRRLHQEGKYLPTCYTLVWPRKALLSWAERQKAEDRCGVRAWNTPHARAAGGRVW